MNSKSAFGSFSVNNIEKAKDFYGKTLGLRVKEESMGVLSVHISDGTVIMIYPKPNHEPAAFTILNFVVDNIDKAVDELASVGVKFEQYTGDLQTDEKGICRSDSSDEGPVGIAWFKDPAGNILSVLQEK